MRARVTGLLAAGLVVCGAGVAEAGTYRHDVVADTFVQAGALPLFEPVGRFAGSNASLSYFGSGTLITDQWVLTAAHVVDIAEQLTFTLNGQQYQAAGWTYHPDWQPGALGNLLNGSDIALVKLDQPVAGVTPARLYGGRNELGRFAAAAGFGRHGTGLTGAVSTDTVRRAGTNVIDSYYFTDRTLLIDFDNPLNTGDSQLGSAVPTALEFLTAPGDSGGALFIEDPVYGVPVVAGVTSFLFAWPDLTLDADYGDLAGFTRVSSHVDWIVDVVVNGSVPLLDGSTARGGVSGGGLLATVSAVPEPGTLGLMAVGAGVLLGRRGRVRGR